MPRRVALLLVVTGFTIVAGAAACGGSGPETGGSQPASSSDVESGAPVPEPQTGLVLAQFVEAAGIANTDEMWRLLSSETQQRLGPSAADFAREYGPKFETGLGAFAGTDYQLVLAVEMPSGWGVAAIAGMREQGGEESFGTYAVALRREGEAWRIELGAPLDLIRVSPEDGKTTETQPEIAIRLKADTPIDLAGLWLDGEPLPATGRGADLKEVVLVGKPGAPLAEGNHVVVAFGESGDTANAGSMPVEVLSPAGQKTVEMSPGAPDTGLPTARDVA